VPGHMPHYMQKNVISEMQQRFSDEWLLTRRQKLRSGEDMQFAFSYFYFLMGETRNITADEVFYERDTNADGYVTLSI
jgi:UDP-N-acetylglucosamine-lysosomal-enzyme